MTTSRFIRKSEEKVFNASLYINEINNTYISSWADWFTESTEESYLTGIIYTIQQSTYMFNKTNLPNLKALLKKHTVKKRIVTYKGVCFEDYVKPLNSNLHLAVYENLGPWEEFVSTTTNILVAKEFAYNYCSNRKGLEVVLELVAEEYFVVSGETRDFGESEVVMINPKVNRIVEVKYAERSLGDAGVYHKHSKDRIFNTGCITERRTQDEYDSLCKEFNLDYICLKKRGNINLVHYTKHSNLGSILEKGLLLNLSKDNSDLGYGIYAVRKGDYFLLDELSEYITGNFEETEEFLEIDISYYGKYLECVSGVNHVGYIVCLENILDISMLVPKVVMWKDLTWLDTNSLNKWEE